MNRPDQGSLMKKVAVNPFTNPDIVTSYESWYETSGRRADRLEKALLNRLLAGFPGAVTLLEVGCGTGHFSRWFSRQGLETTGLDLSARMLAEAVRLSDRFSYGQGSALALPFPTGAFDVVAMITTLEFISKPEQALAEAFRVARQGLLLGVLNGQSRLARQLQAKGGPIWSRAHFFHPAELAHLVKQAAAGRQVRFVWRTTLWPGRVTDSSLPGGGFIGMKVRLYS